jgi:outer membrane protein assembly factor BamD|tara:strand:- start:412 stop:1242 length:831 start_codon:yes stop_codon:yes gene_type:complete
MKFISRLLVLLIFFTFNSCSKDDKKISIIKENNQEDEMIAAYREGVKTLEEGDAFYAAKKFLEAEMVFPQSEWAAKSALMAAYSYYLQNYYFDAILNLERFFETYPKDKSVAYAHYLLAMCYFEKIEGEKRDLKSLIKAKDQFTILIEKYPNTDLALDSMFKIDLLNDILAAKEMYIGRHYIKKEKWIAAINRFKIVLEDYETTVFSEEAIHRLVEIHYKIGLEDEAKKYAMLLGYNYLSGEWYKKSYKIFDKQYEIQKIKKDKGGLIKKFKKLFD